MRNETHHVLLSLRPMSPWAEVWHVRYVFFPRITISGRLVRGKILRRFDGRRWIYKELMRATD
jgi:hypothetical protein